MSFPNVHECPTCKTGLLRRKAAEKGPFWFCSHWNAEPKCEAKFRDIDGKPDLAPPVSCPQCGEGQLRRAAKLGKTPFWFCNRWSAVPKCEAKYQDINGKPDLNPAVKCPTCKEGALKRIRSGTRWIWACNRFKAGCKTTVPDRAGTPVLSA